MRLRVLLWQGYLLEQFEQVWGDGLQPQPGSIGPMLGAGEYSTGQLAHQDVMDALCGPCLPSVPFQKRLSLHVPPVGHYRKVAHPCPVTKELPLLAPHPNRHVAIRLAVLPLVSLGGYIGPLGPLPYPAALLCLPHLPCLLREGSDLAGKLRAHIGT